MLVACVCMVGQSSTVQPATPGATVTVMDLPQSVVYVGPTYGPHFSAAFGYAYLVTQSGGGVYLYYSAYAIPVKNKLPVLNNGAGVATPFKQFKFGNETITILGLGTVGVGQSSTSVTSAFSGGGCADISIGKSAWAIDSCVRFVKSGSVSTKIFDLLIAHKAYKAAASTPNLGVTPASIRIEAPATKMMPEFEVPLNWFYDLTPVDPFKIAPLSTLATLR